jgi:hypothetical protein
MRFLSPHCEAFFEILCEVPSLLCYLYFYSHREGLQKDLSKEIGEDFAAVAHACFSGDVLARGQPFVWPLWEMAFPLSERTTKWLKHSSTLVDALKQQTKDRPFFSLRKK